MFQKVSFINRFFNIDSCTVNLPGFPSSLVFEMAYLLPFHVGLTLSVTCPSRHISLLETLPFVILRLFFDQILSAESLKWAN